MEVSSLVGIDKVKKSFNGGANGDLTVTFPYKEGEIEKISYTLEEGKLNILVKAGENGLSFNEKDVEFLAEFGSVWVGDGAAKSPPLFVDRDGNNSFGDNCVGGKREK